MNESWHPLVPGATDGLPEAEGVFVLGSLVRNVLLIGATDGRGLRDAVEEAVGRSPAARRARCFRHEICPDPRVRQTELLDEYRRAHGGALPPEQPAVAPSLRAVPGSVRRPRAIEPDQVRDTGDVVEQVAERPRVPSRGLAVL